MTLYTALVTVAKVAAPMIPFMTEDIYQNLVRSLDKEAPESIHLCDFPVANEAHIDKDLEAKMEEVLKVVVLGRAARNTANIKNRQPIGRMFVKAETALRIYLLQLQTAASYRWTQVWQVCKRDQRDSCRSGRKSGDGYLK